MSIPITRYVDAVSGVIGAAAAAQRELIGLRFVTDPRLPVGELGQVTSAGAVIDTFGGASVQAAYVSQYFGYVSPAPVSKAGKLLLAPYANVARPARVYGPKRTFDINALKGVNNAQLTIRLEGTTYVTAAMDFTAAVTLADIAGIVQTSVRTLTSPQFTSALVTYDPVASAFNFTSTIAENAAISFPASGTVPESDVATLFAWNAFDAILSPGSVAQTALEALRAAETITDSFGSFSYEVPVALADAVQVATYNASLNVKYMFLHVVSTANFAAHSEALLGIASVGLVLNVKPLEYKEALPQAIMAATNYNRRNAVVNYMFRQGPYTAPFDVTTEPLANVLDLARVNYYGQTSSAGQPLSFFQRGFLCGPSTAPLDMNVHANEQWFKSGLQADYINLLIAIGSISNDDSGRASVLAVLTNKCVQAKRNGTIRVGKVLSTLQQIAVTELTGDPNAWRDVQSNGYWASVEIVEETGPSGLPEYVALYTVAYAKNDVVRKIVGSHNLV